MTHPLSTLLLVFVVFPLAYGLSGSRRLLTLVGLGLSATAYFVLLGAVAAISLQTGVPMALSAWLPSLALLLSAGGLMYWRFGRGRLS